MAETNSAEKILEALKSIDEQMRWCETLDPATQRQYAKTQRDLTDQLRIAVLSSLAGADLSVLQRLDEVGPLMDQVRSATCGEQKKAENIKKAVGIMKQVAEVVCKYVP